MHERDINDRLRRSGDFGPSSDNQMIVTPGVQALGDKVIFALFLAFIQYDGFNDAQTPDHDFGELQSGNTRVWFKIDKAGDHRVLTFLLPSEY